MTARSSGCNTKGAAEAWALAELKKGTVPLKAGGNVTLTQFSQDWFIWGKCPYIRRRLAEGKSISQSYVEGRRQYIVHFILPVLGKKRLSALRRAEIEKWKMDLLGKNLAPGTVNSVLGVLKLMLREACNADLIARNPAAEVGNFKDTPRERGILTSIEVKKLFDENRISSIWSGDKRMYTAHLVMASTGIRLGELQALQVGDLRDGMINVVHAWERKSGLKEPKWNSSRVVPVPSKTAAHLTRLISSSPYRDDPESLVFYGRTVSAPVAQSFLKDSLYDALVKIGIGEDERRKRGIVVHSWRHWFNTMLRAGGVSDVKIRQLTGHRTVAMTDHYTSFGPEHFADAAAIQEEFVFGNRDRKKGNKAAAKKGPEASEKGRE